MPHAVVEWTDNLAADFDVRELLALIAAELRDTDGMFPWGGIRVRGIRLTDYVIADGAGDDAFVNVTLRIAAGRPEEAKKRVFDRLFAAIDAHLAGLFESRSLALSMYIHETEEAASYKHNTIHARLKAQG